MSRHEEKSKSKQGVNAVQQKQTKPVGQRHIISAKQIHKELQRGNTVYLALVLPKSVPVQGMTQQQKREQMKLKGPVRKTFPIAETRKKFCSKSSKTVQKEPYQLLEEFMDLFLGQLPKGRPPKREVEFEIKIKEGAIPLNKPPYRLSPKEYDELQAQINDLKRRIDRQNNCVLQYHE